MAAATGVVPCAGADLQCFEWLYEVHPPTELPVLDLSLSLKSRLLSRQALNRLNVCIQHRLLIGLLAFSANVCYLVTLLAPTRVGRAAGILALISWIPAMIAGVSSLRYDVIVLLVRTYDFWFLSCVNLLVFTVLGGLMGDVRATAMAAAWVGVQANIAVDANIRRVRSWLYLNMFGIVLYVATWTAISFALIDHMQAFSLIKYRCHELPAVAVAMSGLITIIAVFARNVYRRRGMFKKQAHKSRIECASYRTDLQFYPLVLIPKNCSQELHAERPESMKPMTYVQQVGRIDARNTLLSRPILERLSVKTAGFTRHGRTLFSWIGIIGLGLFAGRALYFLRQEPTHAPAEVAAHVLEFAVALVYCGTCALHYHRVVLLALVTSFDFVFLSSQLTAVHLCSCILFNWETENTLNIIVSWIWVHWFLCLDALPPVMKRKLGIARGFIIAELLILTGSCVVLWYLLLFTDLGSSETYDRVLIEMALFGHQKVQIKLISVFFNCLATSAALNCRLIWRVVALHRDALLVLDGVVVFENYLVKAKVRASRRFGSIFTPKRSYPAPTTAETRVAGTKGNSG